MCFKVNLCNTRKCYITLGKSYMIHVSLSAVFNPVSFYNSQAKNMKKSNKWLQIWFDFFPVIKSGIPGAVPVPGNCLIIRIACLPGIIEEYFFRNLKIVAIFYFIIITGSLVIIKKPDWPDLESSDSFFRQIICKCISSTFDLNNCFNQSVESICRLRRAYVGDFNVRGWCPDSKKWKENNEYTFQTPDFYQL